MLNAVFSLDSGISSPLYEQLYQSLLEHIRSGTLAAGTRLPGKRSLAGQLGISVNTVDTAYQMLVAEGYLESRPRSGFRVLACETPLAAAPLPVPAAPPPPPRPQYLYDCSTGGVDTALFPYRTWGRIQRELLYQNPELLRHGHPQGDENLRAAIAAHLRSSRGVACGVEQIVVGAGVEYLLGLAAQLLRGSVAAVENPGYSRTRTILENCDIPCRLTGIDGSGMRVDALRETDANLCYVTPSHHFPTAVTMPAPRRARLLAWASEAPGRYILEDDYDAEFRFDTRPLPSLQGMAGPDGPVLYLSTFSKSLAPSIRIACMVLPRSLAAQFRQKFGVYSCTVSRFEQQTLCRFLEEGHFTRHLNRMRGVYRARMQALCTALREAFGSDAIALQGRHTGLHLLLTLHGGPGERAMVERAHNAGVRLSGLSEYYLDNDTRECPVNTVVLGYAALPDDQLQPLADTLHRIWCGEE